MALLSGYSSTFLGVAGLTVELPTFSPALAPTILSRPSLRNNTLLDYPHFTLVMATDTRSAVYVALNIDQGTLRRSSRSGWSVDRRIPAAAQLDNAYYRNNVYDRGHLARRASTSWGTTEREAQAASDASMTYTNAALQHGSFNQDEWLALEDYVKAFEGDANGRLSVFSGPVYGPPDAPSATFVTPSDGRAPAAVPAAFFKILAYATPRGSLGVSAFLMAQDAAALRDKRGANAPLFDVRAYQVTVMEIEALTGLVFSPAVREANPLRFTPPGVPTPEVPADGINCGGDFPQRCPVDGPGDLTPPVGVEPVRGDGGGSGGVGIVIASALVNPVGPNERADEAVTLVNGGQAAVDIGGWALVSTRSGADAPLGPRGQLLLLQPGGRQTFRLGLPLGNSGGGLRLSDASGRVVDEVTYTGGMVAAAGEGNAVVFRRGA